MMTFYEDYANITGNDFTGVGPHTVAQFDPCSQGPCIGRVEITVVALEDSGAEFVTAYSGTFRRDANSLAIQVEAVASPNLDALLTGMSAAVDVNGTNIRVRVTSILGASFESFVRFEVKGGQPN